MENLIVVMGGSFNPPTIAHQKLLMTAVQELQADKGIFVPAPHEYVKIKMRRAKHPEEVLPESLRLAMLQAMAQEDSRLEVDDLEYHRTEKGYTYETMLDLQAAYPDTVLCFLVGADKLEVIPRWHRIREFIEKFHIVVMKRNGEDPERLMEEHPFFIQHRDMFHIIQSPEGIEGISSSAIREKLRSHEEGAQEICHPAVWKLLQKKVFVNEN